MADIATAHITQEEDEITAWSYSEEETEEPGGQHGVTWNGLCGYFSVSFRVKTPEDALKLFEALKLITEYNVS